MPAQRIIGLAVLGLVAATPAAGALTDPPPAATENAASVVVTGETPPKTKASGKITDPKDPDFVRCRSEPVLNSRAQRVRVCRTNKEWTAAAREGNRRTEELLNMGRPTQPTP
jgi:hypothetical protein